MANKPTQEELDQKIQDALEIPEEELEKPQETEEEVIPKEEEDENLEVDASSDEKGEEEEGASDEEEEAEPSKELFKKKFSASSRENQKINAKNRVLNKALTEAEEIPEPTEEELQAEYAEWDEATNIEKIALKEALIGKKWRKVISEAKNQATKIEKWNDSVNEFIEDPKNLLDFPEIDGKETEFIEFATQEDNNNVPFNVLVGAFIYTQSKNKVSNKGKMFERAKGGANEKFKPRNGKLTLEEGRRLRETDYDQWKQKLSEGKIEFDV